MRQQTSRLRRFRVTLGLVIATGALATALAACGASEPPQTPAAQATSPVAVATSPAAKTTAKPTMTATPQSTPAPTKTKTAKKPATTPPPSPAHKPATTIVFVNVGQGDAIIIKSGSWTGMIDGGPSGSAGAIEAALRKLGVSHLSAVVITHPHADHTGGLQDVILDDDPPVAYVGEGAGSDADELRAVGAKVVRVHAGQTLAFGRQRARVLAPSSLTGDPNEDSVVLLLDIGGKRLLFAGDSSGPEEAAVGAQLARGPPLYLLKVAHHGSQYSSTSTFLNETDPRFAVICLGPNSYGHPTPATVSRLRRDGATIFSTQKNGTITLTINAAGAASWRFAKGSAPVTSGASGSGSSSATSSGSGASASSGTASGGTIVYITETGECYHRSGCRYLSHSKIPASLKEAKARGYRPCSVCDPPR